jgi:hypothetical protein
MIASMTSRGDSSDPHGESRHLGGDSVEFDLDSSAGERSSAAEKQETTKGDSGRISIVDQQQKQARLKRKHGDTSRDSSTTSQQLSAAEQKRDREKRRRSELNETLDDLSDLVFQIDPGLTSGRVEGIVDMDDSDDKVSRTNTVTNRTELIRRTVRLLKRIYTENQEKEKTISNLRRIISSHNQGSSDAVGRGTESQPDLPNLAASSHISELNVGSSTSRTSSTSSSAFPSANAVDMSRKRVAPQVPGGSFGGVGDLSSLLKSASQGRPVNPAAYSAALAGIMSGGGIGQQQTASFSGSTAPSGLAGAHLSNSSALQTMLDGIFASASPIDRLQRGPIETALGSASGSGTIGHGLIPARAHAEGESQGLMGQAQSQAMIRNPPRPLFKPSPSSLPASFPHGKTKGKQEEMTNQPTNAKKK